MLLSTFVAKVGCGQSLEAVCDSSAKEKKPEVHTHTNGKLRKHRHDQDIEHGTVTSSLNNSNGISSNNGSSIDDKLIEIEMKNVTGNAITV